MPWIAREQRGQIETRGAREQQRPLVLEVEEIADREQPRSARQRREREPQRLLERCAARLAARGADERTRSPAHVTEHERLASETRAAIVVEGDVEPPSRGFAGEVVVADVTADVHRERRIERDGEEQRALLEDDARLQSAGPRRRRPIDAPRVVAVDVGAQFGKFIAVAAP